MIPGFTMVDHDAMFYGGWAFVVFGQLLLVETDTVFP